MTRDTTETSSPKLRTRHPATSMFSPPPPPLPTKLLPPQLTLAPSPSSSEPGLSPPPATEPQTITRVRHAEEVTSESLSSLSRSLPRDINNSTKLKHRKSLVERQQSRFTRLFKEEPNSFSQPTSPGSLFGGESEEPNGLLMIDTRFNINAQESQQLLQSCYSSIANLRVEVDRWQTRGREAQARAVSLDEEKRSIMAERNVLQQRLLEAEQDAGANRSRVQSLSAEVDELDLEADKLRRENHRLRKLAYRQDEADTRIAELEQLLSESKKLAGMSDTQYHRLLSQHEKLKKAHRKLQQSSQRGGVEAEVYEKIAWLRESNDKLRSALNDLTNLRGDTKPNTCANCPDGGAKDSTRMSTLVGVVNQLIIANGRLKSEVLGYCDLISDYQAENKRLREQKDKTEATTSPKISKPRLRRRSSLSPVDTTFDLPKPKPSEQQPRPPTTLLDELKSCECTAESLPNSPSTLTKCRSMATFLEPHKRESGIFTTHIPMHHLYQDGWLSNTDESETEELVTPSRMQTPIPSTHHKRNPSNTSTYVPDPTPVPRPPQISTATDSIRDANNKKSSLISPQEIRRFLLELNSDDGDFGEEKFPQLPIPTLVDLAKELLSRLQSAEPKSLNKKLQRSFDMNSLAPLSNELIKNILENVGLIALRFKYLASTGHDSTENHPQSNTTTPLRHRASSLSKRGVPQPSLRSAGSSPLDTRSGATYIELVNQFTALVELVQNLLLEIGSLRMVNNDLSLAFVNKMADMATSPPASSDGYCSTRSVSGIRQWPIKDASKRPPSLLRSAVNNSSTANILPALTSHRRSISNPDGVTLSKGSHSPMLVKNGVVNYSPHSSLSVDPVFISSSISTSSCDTMVNSSNSGSSANLLRKIVNGQPIVTPPLVNLPLKSSSSISDPLVSITSSTAHRSMVVSHSYSLMAPPSPPLTDTDDILSVCRL